MSSLDLFGNPSSSSPKSEQFKHGPPPFVFPVNETEEIIPNEDDHKRSFNSLLIGAGITATLLSGQAFRLQVVQGTTNRSLAEGNSVRILNSPPDRGLIEDVNGQILAQNSRHLALAIDPRDLPSKKVEREIVYGQLKEKAGITDETIAQIEENRSKSPTIFAIKTNLSKDDSLLYKEWFNHTPGVVIQEFPIRLYSSVPSLGHLLGYVGSPSEKDVDKGITQDRLIGKTGLEYTYNNLLEGTPGKEKAEANAFGDIIDSSRVPLSLPESGRTLRLSIDSRLQNIVATALNNELARRKTKFGDLDKLGASAVVVDPSTGAVKAMVSLPDYNDQKFSQGISSADYKALIDNPGNPLLNRAIQGQYQPGSTVKPMIAAAALQMGIVTDTTSVVTPEAIYVGDFRFPDWKVHGQTNIRKAIAESNNIFFYALGGGWKEKDISGLGIDGLNNALENFGLGEKLGIDLPGEVGGLIATPEWKRDQIKEPWYIGDTYHTSIGQGYTLVTPLQMALATATIANGGTLWKPSLLWSTINPTTKKETLKPHQAIRQAFISPENLKVVREGMRQTVLSGSSRPLNTLLVTSAGKTGTAEFTNSKGLYHAWYTGFAPYENPELAFSIIIEGGGESFYSSVPVAEEILRGYFNEPLAPGQQLSSNVNDPATSEFSGER